MLFKELRPQIFCQCKVIVDNYITDYLNTHEQTDFDEHEVIGIRARELILNGFNAGAYIEVLCK